MALMENYSLVSLAWVNFQAENQNHIKQLRTKADFSDVTLVTDDGQVKSHKMVLAAGSSFFQQLLKEVLTEHSQPCIYLWGVNLKQLNHLLDLLYLGDTEMPEENVNQFLEIVKQLGVRGLVTEPTEGCENVDAMKIEAKPEINDEDKSMSTKDHKFVVENFPENVLKVKRSVARNFPCNDCPYMDRDRNGLRRHMQRKHTEREGGFECKRVWCLVRMPTLYEIILHMADCKWFCSAPSCSRRGLLRTRDIQDHESFHKAQSNKFGI